MQRLNDIISSFFMAAGLHVFAFLTIGWIYTQSHSELVPSFRRGLSGVVLDLVPVSEGQMSRSSPEMDDSISFHMPEEDKENGKTRNQAAWDVRQKGVDSSCDLRAMIHPAYPIGAVRRGEEGTVVLRITVGENGRAVDVAVEKTSGYPALDRSAVRAVERADFVSPDGTDSQGGEIVLPFTYRLVDR